MVCIEDVSFQYEAQQGTLNHISLEIKPGECVLLCGESGCGKTTVTKLVNGLIPHFVEGGTVTGVVEVDKLKVSETAMYLLAERVGSVFQNPKSQFFNIDSDSELVFGLENAGVAPELIRERLTATTSALHIESLLGRNIFSMSGGEKQILAFASVYAMNPDIFVLDEPTANLDVAAIELLKQLIVQIKKEGRTVIIAEHRLYFLMELIDRAVFIRNGEIEQIYTRTQLQQLTEQMRISMGLRTLTPPVLQLHSANIADLSEATKGLFVDHLSCAFDKQNVFTDLSFQARPGEILGIVGQNGTGKTTLTRCLCGLLKECSGTVAFNGTVLKPKARNKISFCVMQDVNHQLFSDSVWNECKLTDSQPVSIEKVLGALDLLDYKERHPMALSGGQKQRLAVATAILSEKPLLIFDEPTSGLDYKRMVEVGNMIRELKAHHKIVLVISHDYEFLERICDRIFVMPKN